MGSVGDRDIMEGFLEHGAGISPSKVKVCIKGQEPWQGVRGARDSLEWIQTQPMEASREESWYNQSYP